MSCPAFTVGQVNQSLYNKLLATANAAGAKIDGSIVKYKGCTFSFEYYAGMAQLVVTCVEKPLIFPCDTIKQHVLDLVNQAEKEGI